MVSVCGASALPALSVEKNVKVVGPSAEMSTVARARLTFVAGLGWAPVHVSENRLKSPGAVSVESTAVMTTLVMVSWASVVLVLVTWTVPKVVGGLLMGKLGGSPIAVSGKLRVAGLGLGSPVTSVTVG